MDVVTAMSKKFNFSYTVVVPHGQHWGRGALEGDATLIDMVKVGDVDMGVCGVWYTYDLQVIDFFFFMSSAYQKKGI